MSCSFQLALDAAGRLVLIGGPGLTSDLRVAPRICASLGRTSTSAFPRREPLDWTRTTIRADLPANAQGTFTVILTIAAPACQHSRPLILGSLRGGPGLTMCKFKAFVLAGNAQLVLVADLGSDFGASRGSSTVRIVGQNVDQVLATT